MKLKQLCALLLSAILMLLCVSACNPSPTNDSSITTADPTTNQTPSTKPSTPQEYITVAWEKLLTAAYKETTVQNGTIVMGDIEMPRNDTTVMVCNGKNFFMEDTEYGMTQLLYDGVLYFTMGDTVKNKYPFPANWESDPDLNPAATQDADLKNLQFNALTLETDASGNTVIVGKGTTSSAASILESAFASIGAAGGPTMTIDYNGVECRATLDAQYRLLKQTVKMTSYIETAGIRTTYTIEKVITYEYGNQYVLSAPADASAYTTVGSLAELFQ